LATSAKKNAAASFFISPAYPRNSRMARLLTSWNYLRFSLQLLPTDRPNRSPTKHLLESNRSSQQISNRYFSPAVGTIPALWRQTKSMLCRGVRLAGDC
jgi:hypothetical protein